MYWKNIMGSKHSVQSGFITSTSLYYMYDITISHTMYMKSPYGMYDITIWLVWQYYLTCMTSLYDTLCIWHRHMTCMSLPYHVWHHKYDMDGSVFYTLCKTSPYDIIIWHDITISYTWYHYMTGMTSPYDMDDITIWHVIMASHMTWQKYCQHHW